MRTLILGGSGMLGHKLWSVLSSEFDCWVTFRRSFEKYRRYSLFSESRSLCEADLSRSEVLDKIFDRIRPQAVVNAVGIVKQLSEAQDPILNLEINSLLPHRLAQKCRRYGARLIHISTDCVFSGKRGRYSEDDVTDAHDLYGRTKALGEVTGEQCLTLRTSLIGRELDNGHGLVEWFLSRRNQTVKGFTHALFSGLVTTDLARLIAQLLRGHSELSGLYHVAAAPISKYDLLCLIRDRFALSVVIQPDDALKCDRSLDGSRFHRETGIEAPSWSQMIETLWSDTQLYDRWRTNNASGQ